MALIVSDQRMPQMTGIELLEQARGHAPGAKFLLLTAYADTDVAIKAINDIGLDHYLLKPWDPPEERLYPVVDDLLERLARARTPTTPPTSAWSATAGPTAATRSRRSWPATTCPTGGTTSSATPRRSGSASSPSRRPDDLPLVLVPDGRPAALPHHPRPRRRRSACAPAPSSRSTTCASSAAARPGWRPRCTPRPRACSTVVVEREAPGGQAGQSAAIENYLGFPKGLTGADLTQRAVAQVSRFGAEMVLARDVVGFESRGPVRAVLLRRGPARSRPAR